MYVYDEIFQPLHSGIIIDLDVESLDRRYKGENFDLPDAAEHYSATVAENIMPEENAPIIEGNKSLQEVI